MAQKWDGKGWSGAQHGSFWKFICPLCQADRRISGRSRPGGMKHFLQIGLTAFVFMMATWNWMSWKGIVSFVPFWVLFELGYRWKMRAMLCCTQCGFDPNLFMVDEKRARQEIEAHWRKKFLEKGIPYPEPQQPHRRPPPSATV